VETIELVNDGSGLGFGIVGGKSTGVIVKTILPGGVADQVNSTYTYVYHSVGCEVASVIMEVGVAFFLRTVKKERASSEFYPQ